jgi:co-chaperonin GroES (HSP10)
MKPIKDRIIIQYDVQQKEFIQYGTLKLFTPNRALLNENAREANPTAAMVLHGGNTFLKKGDVILFPHTILDTPSAVIEKDGTNIIMTIPTDQNKVTIYGKIGKNGEVIPLFGNLVVKRISQKELSSIIITPDQFKKDEENKGIILAAPPDSDLHEGQTIIYYKYSDYELCYNVNGEEKRSIMVKRQDVVAIYK